MTEMKLYAWQEECLSAWENHDCRGIVNVVTGAGKTILALSVIRRFLTLHPDARIKIVVPTIPLAHQWQTVLTRQPAIPEANLLVHPEQYQPGLFGAGRRDSSDRRIMIYIINSARDTLARHMEREFALGHFVLLICDECHHCQSKQNRRIFDFRIPGFATAGLYACLGLSATPFGTANDEVLIRALGPEIYHYGFRSAAEDGIVTPFILCDVAVPFLTKEHEEYSRLSFELGILLHKLLGRDSSLRNLPSATFMKAVTKMAREAEMDPAHPAVQFLLKSWERKKLSTLARSRTQCALDLICQLPDRKRILIFSERISQAEEMIALLRRKFGSGRCVLYHSGMSRDARKRNMQAFQDGSARILVSCRCLDEGIDVPDAEVGIVLSSTAVPRQRIQRLGRILRRSDGKLAASLYYLYIRESADDSSFLHGLENTPGFLLRYDPADHSFINEVYEYSALELLNSAQEHGLQNAQLRELRRCLLEGLIRTDSLMDSSVLKSLRNSASDRHEYNYWQTMRQMNRLIAEKHPEKN